MHGGREVRCGTAEVRRLRLGFEVFGRGGNMEGEGEGGEEEKEDCGVVNERFNHFGVL